MTTDKLCRQRAKKAREQAEATADPENRQLWLEIAHRFERLGDLPGKTPWHVERAERKKPPR